MKKLPLICIMSLCSMLLLSEAGWCSQQKRVYLKDGGIIECRSFGRSNGKITVVVNRDVVLELNRNEVDLKRTFAAPVHRVKHTRAGARKRGAVPDRLPAKPSPAAAMAAPQQGKMPSMTNPVSASPQKAGIVAATPPPPKPVAPVPVTPPPTRPALKALSPPAVPASPTTALLGGLLGIGTLLPFLLLLVLMIASIWKVFVKAGEAGWKGLIPIYNVFLLVQIAGKPWWWFLLLFIPGVNIVIGVLMNIALAARFGQGALFGLGLSFLGIIFFPVLAFGKSEYN